MEASATKIDRASWTRYRRDNSDRCETCGNRAVVKVTMTAAELGGGKGSNIASESHLYCNEHGLQRYGDARIKLNGGQR